MNRSSPFARHRGVNVRKLVRFRGGRSVEPVDTQLSSFLLAQIEWQLDKISERQHQLARSKALLQEQATRLRLGAPAAEIRLPVRMMSASWTSAS